MNQRRRSLSCSCPFAVVIAALLAGCASAPPPRLVAPALDIALFHRSGSALARASRPAEGIDPAGAFVLRVRGTLLGVRAGVEPVALTNDVARSAELLLEPVTDDPIRGTLREVGVLRVAVADDGRALQAAIDAALTDETRGIVFYEGRGALPDGVVATVRVVARDGVEHRLSIARDGGTARLSIGREVGGGARADDLVLLETRLRDDGVPIVIAAPDGPNWLTFECAMTPGDPADPEHVAALERCAAEMNEGLANLAAETAPFTRAEADSNTRERAWRALAETDSRVRRAALLVLLGDDGGFSRDFATSIDDALLEVWIGRLTATIVPAEVDDAAMHWAIERAAIELCAERIDQTAATPAEFGLLLRHFGEVGRFANDLARYARAVDGRAQFETWAIEENLRLLGSSDPAARVRSFDWLAQRGAAPADYRPFDDRDTRRAALRRATDASRRSMREGLDIESRRADETEGVR